MNVKKRYHPSQALNNPLEFYRQAFENNYPHAGLVRFVGSAAVKLSSPNFVFPNNANAQEYFSAISSDEPVKLSLSHVGKKRFHDVIGGLAAVFAQTELMQRVPDMRVWAATPYMTDRRFGPVISRLGGIPVNRSHDYEAYGLNETDISDKKRVTSALIQSSINYLLDSPGRTLVIFPAGTKDSAAVKNGVGQVAEALSYGKIIPISMASSVQETSNIPSGLVCAFGEPVEIRSGTSASTYVDLVKQSQDKSLILANQMLAS